MPLFCSLPALLLLSSGAQAAQLVRGPYLQQTTPTSVIVAFELDENATPHVWLGRHGVDEVGVASTGSGTHHEVSVDGLEPDTRYLYAIHLGDQALAEGHELRTAVEPGSSFSFLVYGDSRSGHDDHTAVTDAMEQEGADFALHTGDLVSDGEDPEQWDTFFAIEQPMIERIPLFPVVGNHDEYDGDALLFREAFALPGNELYYSFDWGSAHFTVLDGHVNTVLLCEQEGDWIAGCFDEDQLAWLQQDLETACMREETEMIFVAVHDGPYSSKTSRDGNEQMRVLMPLFEEYGVTAIFSGHDHYYERGLSSNGIPYVVSAGAGASLYEIGEPNSDPHTVLYNESVHHWVKVNVVGNELRLAARLTDGTLFDSATIESRSACEPLAEDPTPTEPAQGCACTSSLATSERVLSNMLLLFAASFLGARRRRTAPGGPATT